MKKNYLFTLLNLVAILSFGQITSYPYFEDFETGSNGWTANNVSNGSWSLGTPSGQIINSASSGVNAWVTNLNGNYNANEDSWVESPIFDFTNLNNPSIQLKVWWNAEFSWDGMVLQSSIDNGLTWQVVGTYGDFNNWYTDNTINSNPGGQNEGWTGRNATNNGSGGYVSASHSLSGLGGQSNVLLRFAFASDGVVHDEGVAFDDVSIFEVSCPQPINLSVTNITPYAADIQWVEQGSATIWDIEWGVSGFTPTGTPNEVGTSSNLYTFINLSPVTSYDYYVRADCGALDGTSFWSGPYTFTTLCPAVNAPWLDDVETHSPTTILSSSNCWSSTGTSFDWNIDGAGSTPSPNTGPVGANSGTNYFYIEASNGSQGDSALLFTPMIDISSLSIPSLQFYYHMHGSDIGKLYIEVFDGTWSVVDSIIGEQQNNQSDAWALKIIDLSSYSGLIQINFIGIKGSSYLGDIAIDDIELKEAPSCYTPTNLNALNITSTTADLTWFQSGVANHWEIEFGMSGFTPTGIPNIQNVTNNPYTLTNLLSAVSYDFYVRADCGATNGLSSWAGPYTFKTLCAEKIAPWLDDVETHSPSTSFTNSECWEASSTVFDWNIDGLGSTPSSNTGPVSAFSGTNFFYVESTFGNTSDTAILISPVIDITGLNTPTLQFYYHMHGATMGDLYVEIYNGTWNLVDSILGEQHPNQTDPWSLRVIDLSQYTGNIRVRFKGVKGGSYTSDISIDDIEILEASTTGVEDELSLDLTLSPNPSNGLFYINSSKTDSYNVQVFDLRGRVIYSDLIVLSKAKSVIDVRKYVEDGVYLVKVFNSESLFTQKIVINQK